MSRSKHQSDTPARKVGRRRTLRPDCVEFVPQPFDFSAGSKGWAAASAVQCFACPTCGGEGNVRCDECRGRGERAGEFCPACEGMGATGCEECEGGVVPNQPTRNIVYPLPEAFDDPEALARLPFAYIIVVKLGSRSFLAYALPEWHMRTVSEMPVAMMEAYLALGFLPPARLAISLLDGTRLDRNPGRRLLNACHRSLVMAARRWAALVRKLERKMQHRRGRR